MQVITNCRSCYSAPFLKELENMFTPIANTFSKTTDHRLSFSSTTLFSLPGLTTCLENIFQNMLHDYSSITDLLQAILLSISSSPVTIYVVDSVVTATSYRTADILLLSGIWQQDNISNGMHKHSTPICGPYNRFIHAEVLYRLPFYF